jgi:hypothetical protein
VQNDLQTCLGADQTLPRIFRIFWDLFSLSLSIFYLFEGSKTFFMRSKHFFWIAHVPICLWEFSLNFWDFMSIFCALNELTGVSLEFVCTENVF